MNSFIKIVKNFIKNRSEESMMALINRCKKITPSCDEIAYLAMRLANFGDKIKTSKNYITADIASTGGPASLSTLLCPIYLVLLGYRVIKLGVPGRPAGGVDVLAQIPGYRVSLTAIEIKEIIEKCGYVHCLANDNNAPLDRDLFAFRKKVGALNIPALVTASILAKKIVTGIKISGLEIRVANYGNFGDTWRAANKNASLYCRVAKKLGMKAVCFLTDGLVPNQPYIGRGESLVAITNILNNNQNSWLRDHQMLCYRMSRSLLNLKQPIAKSQLKFEEIFEQNLIMQSSSVRQLVEHAQKILDDHTIEIRSKKEGFLKINLEIIRTCIVAQQMRYAKHKEDYPDPCGLILKRKTNDYVLKNELLATLRVNNKESKNVFIEEINSAFVVTRNGYNEHEFKEVAYA